MASKNILILNKWNKWMDLWKGQRGHALQKDGAPVSRLQANNNNKIIDLMN